MHRAKCLMSSSGLSDNQILAIVRIEVFFRVDPRSGRNKFLVRFLGEILLLLLRIDLQREDLLILARCCNVFIFFRLILTCSLTFDKKLYFKIYLLQFILPPSFVNEKISIIKKGEKLFIILFCKYYSFTNASQKQLFSIIRNFNNK